jgi:hypothetical protein
MRGAILVLPILAFALWPASPAAAAPWCLFDSGGRDCSFYTFQECTEGQSGVGGYCGRNPDEPVGAPSGAQLGPPPGPASDYMPPPPGLDPGAPAPGAPAQVPSNWCAYESGGGQNCGFPTYQACMADISGVGGECVPAGR